MRLMFVFVAAVALFLTGCGPGKPAYSEMQTNRNARTANQNGGSQASAQSPNAAAPQPAPPAAEPVKPKVPTFMDLAKGQIKDLPSYPNSRRLNVMYGPLEGVDQALFLLQAGAPVNKVADFYEKAMKTNGWTVVNTTRTPELYTVEAKKGESQEALVQVKKDPQSEATLISLTRIEKPAPPQQ